VRHVVPVALDREPGTAGRILDALGRGAAEAEALGLVEEGEVGGRDGVELGCEAVIEGNLVVRVGVEGQPAELPRGQHVEDRAGDVRSLAPRWLGGDGGDCQNESELGEREG